METMIEARGLQYKYREDAKTLTLQGLDVQIQAGEFVAVLGHNGSGKSTFAKHCNAILLPSGGSIYVAGMDTRDESRLYAIRQKAGMVFQNPDNQLVATIVEEDVAFGPENLGVEPKEIRRRVDAALRAVGMYDFRERATYQLSGGQKQRIAIAGILAMQPACLIMDEPTAMLDPVGRREVMDAILTLRRELGITVVLITHHMDEAAMADRIIVMTKGSILMEGTPREVFAREAELRRAELDVPQGVALVHRLREAGVDIRTDVLTEEECAAAIAEALQKAGK